MNETDEFMNEMLDIMAEFPPSIVGFIPTEQTDEVEIASFALEGLHPTEPLYDAIQSILDGLPHPLKGAGAVGIVSTGTIKAGPEGEGDKVLMHYVQDWQGNTGIRCMNLTTRQKMDLSEAPDGEIPIVISTLLRVGHA